MGIKLNQIGFLAHARKVKIDILYFVEMSKFQSFKLNHQQRQGKRESRLFTIDEVFVWVKDKEHN